MPVEAAVFRPGDLIILSQGDTELAEIVVDRVKQRTKYAGTYSDDVPAAGNVYIEMFVTYRAIAENADYSSFDWEVYVDDLAIDGFTFLLNGPEPELGTGSLPKGRRAEGWLVFEIPKTGRAVLSYRANMFTDDPPAFEIVLRNE